MDKQFLKTLRRNSVRARSQRQLILIASKARSPKHASSLARKLNWLDEDAESASALAQIYFSYGQKVYDNAIFGMQGSWQLTPPAWLKVPPGTRNSPQLCTEPCHRTGQHWKCDCELYTSEHSQNCLCACHSCGEKGCDGFCCYYCGSCTEKPCSDCYYWHHPEEEQEEEEEEENNDQDDDKEEDEYDEEYEEEEEEEQESKPAVPEPVPEPKPVPPTAAERLQKVACRILSAANLQAPVKMVTTIDGQRIQAGASTNHIEVTESLINLLDDDELGFMLGHEAAHIEKKHIERFNEAMEAAKNGYIEGMKRVDKELERRGRGLIARGLAMTVGLGLSYPTAKITFGQFSQQHETEADERALELMEQAGYDKKAAARALKKFYGGHLPECGMWESLTSSHPEPIKRTGRIEKK